MPGRERKNIMSLMDRANADDILFGQNAYHMYHSAMRSFALFYGTGFVQTVEAFVALSPNNAYHTNLRSLSAVQFSVASGTPLDQLTVSTFGSCARRAHGYLTGSVSFSDTVGGDKITSFRHNILYPDSSHRVTVDGHMISVWAGKDMTMREANAYLRTKGRYKLLEGDFQSVARRVKLPPCQLQATLWAARKREVGILYSEQKDLFSGMTRWLETPRPEDYPPFQRDIWTQWLSREKHAC